MLLLALETSCDETSAAVVRGGEVLSNVVSSQVGLHAEYGGVVPELAAREHLRNLIPVTQAALCEASVTVGQLEAVAATQGPGLPSALMVGVKAAQAFAFALRRPFIGIHHHEAHLYSPWIRSLEPPNPVGTRSTASPSFREEFRDAGGTRPYQERMRGQDFQTSATPKISFVADFAAFQPNVSLIVSGGHTLLVRVKAELNHRVLGSTVDDAAGECFDKVGKLMGLAYPAGAEIDRLAEQGNSRAFDFPRPMLHDANDDFSFSGLKTSVRYFLRDNPHLLDDAQKIRDLCASVQAAIVEVLVTKTIRAARRLRVRCVTASGGVTCNRALRAGLAAACAREGFTLRLAERALCTDNAAMIGIIAERKFLAGQPATSFDAEIAPGMPFA
jgi:N6-L-threonylcarbamoyladenine synthase